MIRTQNLRRQHDAAIELVGEIVALRDTWRDPEDSSPIVMLIARLTGILRIHFAQEDLTLYPYMTYSLNHEAASTATVFQEEMGGLAAVFADFVERWASPAAVSADFAGFCRDSEAVFAALVNRIVRENQTLYPVADAIQPHEVRQSA